MLTNLPFVKYSSNGNSFVIVDEIERSVLTENDKNIFAKKATDINFGVGCDNFIILQKYSTETLKEINKFRNYWNDRPNNNEAKFIFRMLEPDGNEALSCGNGLLCIANYLFRKYSITRSEILTESPSMRPRLLTIGTDSKTEKSFVNMGFARKVPDTLVNPCVVEEKTSEIDKISNLKIIFRSNDLNFLSNINEVYVDGYLVFTGEPHLVLFVDNAFSLEFINNFFFIKNERSKSISKNYERRANFGKWLVNHIGFFLNNKNHDIFPLGINVNFARVIDRNKGIIEYRTYERGINHETLSCGTGAIAVAHISKELNLVSKQVLTLMPYYCRLYDKKANVSLKQNKKNWILFGAPKLLFYGEFKK